MGELLEILRKNEFDWYLLIRIEFLYCYLDTLYVATHIIWHIHHFRQVIIPWNIIYQ